MLNWYKNLSPAMAKSLLALGGSALAALAVWKPALAPYLVGVAGLLKSPLSDHPVQ